MAELCIINILSDREQLTIQPVEKRFSSLGLIQLIPKIVLNKLVRVITTSLIDPNTIL